jgi:glutathione S-transferase
MSLLIHQMAHSPFCIPITTALDSLGVAYEAREVPNWDRSEIIRLTGGAYYQVPVLIHDGRVVYESGPDSQDVAQYVDRNFAGGRLFPKALAGPQLCVIEFLENEVEARGFKLADIHYVPAIADLVARTMVVRHKERRFGRGCVEQWRANAAAIRAELDALLSRFETTLTHQPFLFGEAPVYGDFLLHGVTGNFLYHGWNTLSPAQPALTAFRERLAAFRFVSA